jgi:hypothetical protein
VLEDPRESCALGRGCASFVVGRHGALFVRLVEDGEGPFVTMRFIVTFDRPVARCMVGLQILYAVASARGGLGLEKVGQTRLSK